MPTGPLLPSKNTDFSGHECSFLQDQGNSYATRRLYNGIVARVSLIQRQVLNPRSKIFPHQDPNGSKYEYRTKKLSKSVVVSLREQTNTRLSRALELQSFLMEKCRLLEAIELWNRSKPLVLRNQAIHFPLHLPSDIQRDNNDQLTFHPVPMNYLNHFKNVLKLCFQEAFSAQLNPHFGLVPGVDQKKASDTSPAVAPLGRTP